MKKPRMKVLALALGLGLYGSPAVFASGIPTVDVANIAQLVLNAQQQAQEALSALETAKDGIEQAKSQFEAHKSMITGNDSLGDFLNNPALNKVLPLSDWSDIYESVRDIEDLRRRYGLTSDDSTVQKKFDSLLAVADALERTYEASGERLKNANALRDKLNQAETPQQKEDLQLRYQHEMLELQVQQMRLSEMQALVAQQEKMQNKQRIQGFKDYVNGRRADLPN